MDYILIERENNWSPVSFGNGDIVVYGDREEAEWDIGKGDLLCEVRYPATGTLVLYWKGFGVERQYDAGDEESFQTQLRKAVEDLRVKLPCHLVTCCAQRGLLEKPEEFDTDCMFSFVWDSGEEDIDDILDRFEDLPNL